MRQINHIYLEYPKRTKVLKNSIMLPKTYTLWCIIGTFLLFNSTILAFDESNSALVLNDPIPYVHFDFEECVSFLGGSNSDYSEFTAMHVDNPLCSQFEVLGGYLYRSDSLTHSCTPGYENSIAMCVSGVDTCTYNPDSNEAIKIDLQVVPGPDGLGSIREIQFFQRAPEQFSIIEGPTGLNNYPTLYGIRIFKNGVEVYRQEDVPTTRDWNFERFILSGDADFFVTDTTVYNIEILPYCLVGNAGTMQAWDIDDLRIIGGCHNIRGGFVSTNSPTTICSLDSLSSTIEFNVSGNLGPRERWIVTDDNGIIQSVGINSSIDFNNFETGIYRVYHLSYIGAISKIREGLPLSGIIGCISLSNGVTINNFNVNGGELFVGNQSTEVSVCAGDGEDDLVILNLSGEDGIETNYIITDEDSIILQITSSDTLNFKQAGPGTCYVFALSSGEPLSGFTEGVHINDIDGCFALSNPVTVIRESFEAGTIETDNSSVVIMTCSGDGQEDIIEVNLQGADSAISSWIVSDTLGNILSISDSNIFDFENAGLGVCEIYHMSYGDSSLLDGQNLNLNSLNGCFDLSNTITIIRDEVDGGQISINGSTNYDICPTDTNTDSVPVDLINAAGDTMTWVLTDETGVILELSDNSVMDFSDLADGMFQLWNISYSFGLSNLVIGNNIDSVMGCFDFSNPISISKIPINGGSISLEDGSTSTEVCVGDGIDENLEAISVDASGVNSIWLVTDTLGNVLNTTDSNIFNFDSAGGGVCQIWHLVFADSTTIAGDSLNINSLEGCFALSNNIEVIRNAVNGGVLTTIDGETEVNVVVGDSIPDLIDVDLDAEEGDFFSWIITDTLGEILSLPDTFPVDFNDAGTGICQIWNVSFNDSIVGLEVGLNVSDLVGCFDLSNPVTINRSFVLGGQIMTVDSLLAVEVCSGDNISDLIDVVVEGNEGTNSAWVVSDTSGLILSLPVSPPIDFEGAGGGICLIWHLSYENGLSGLEEGMDLSDLSGLYSLSNTITVSRNGVDGGSILTSDSLDVVFVCSGDGVADDIDVVISEIEGDSSQWVITDTSGVVLGLPDNPPFGFEGAEEGICLIWHLSYSTGLEGLEMDSSINNIVGCFDFSNSINVERTEVAGGNLLTDTGVDTLNIIAGDGISDEFDVVLTDTIGLFSDWIITNALGQIIGLPTGPPFDLENAGGGQCQIWHLSSNDVQILEFGMTLAEIEGCHDLSNPITVIREGLSGGVLTALDGLTSVDLCILNMMSDSVDVILTDTSGSLSSWAITDTLGIILSVPTGPLFDFSTAGTGVCQIWHISHEDNMMGLEVDSLIFDLEGSVDLSNPLNIIRNEVESGTIMTSDSLTEVMIMVNDGISDLITAVVDGNLGETSTWIVTDTLGTIMDFGMNATIDFENSGSGVCQIWHMSSAGIVTGLAEGNNLNQLDGCYEISNAITVIRDGLNGGILTTIDFSTVANVCIGDELSEQLITILSDTIGSNFEWIISDTSGVILGLPTGSPFDFETAGVGICELWHLAYENGLEGDTIGGNINTITGSHDFSNSITVIREEVDGGSLLTDDSLTQVMILVGEGIDDTINVQISNIVGDSSAWIISDTLGVILALPANPPFLFEDAGAGVCEIWHLSYNTGLTGLAEGNNISQLDGCYDLSNSISVIRDELNGGVLSSIDGLMNISICQSDTINDTIFVSLTDTMGSVSDWAIVNNVETILNIPTGPPFVLDTINQASCQIYHISSNGNLSGLELGEDIANLSGGFNLSNPLDVSKVTTVGGSLTTIDGLTEITIAVGEGINDTIDVILTGNTGDTSLYLVTDTLGSILAFPGAAPFLFEDAGAGVCQLWSISYAAGIEGLIEGELIDDIEGCFDFSNAITIIREGVNGGNLTTDNGLTDITVCVGDGINDNIGTILTDTVGTNFNWVLTNESNIMMGIPIGPPFNFENAPVLGTTKIWHLAYDSISPPVDNGLIGQNIDVFTGNFDFSNPINVMKEEVAGGTISTLDNTTIVVGAGTFDTITVSLMGELGDSTTFFVTDTLGNIMNIQDSNEFTFESAGAGVCQIWHIGFTTGIFGLEVGNHISVLFGCFSLSNEIEVTRLTNEPIIDNGGNRFDYLMYPVPAKHSLNFEFRMMPSSEATIYIYNRVGKLIETVEVKGKYSDVDLREYNTGMYYIKIRSGSASTANKFIIVK